MRKRIVAGNWKMNTSFAEAEELISEIIDNLNEHDKPENVDVIICVPFPFLELATDLINDTSIMAGAQNISQFSKGAYTGEVSAMMLHSMEVTHSIIGHSERRKYFNEEDATLAEKVNRAIENAIAPIFCVGELLEEREAEKHFSVVQEQFEKGLFHLAEKDFLKVIIAYEPVWAIGTGVTATPGQAQEMHSFIRETVGKNYNAKIAEETTILYGGSCNPKNARELFANPDVDGGLIGGASLKSEDFCAIIRSFE
jgi:triosephosphate isomerase